MTSSACPATNNPIIHHLTQHKAHSATNNNNNNNNNNNSSSQSHSTTASSSSSSSVKFRRRRYSDPTATGDDDDDNYNDYNTNTNNLCTTSPEPDNVHQQQQQEEQEDEKESESSCNSDFQDVLKTKGLELVEMKGDGNCLFRAISLQVLGDVESHLDVRKRCLDFMVRILLQQHVVCSICVCVFFKKTNQLECVK